MIEGNTLLLEESEQCRFGVGESVEEKKKKKNFLSFPLQEHHV